MQTPENVMIGKRLALDRSMTADLTVDPESRAALLRAVQQIVAASTSADAAEFDAERWLERWLLTPQRPLGGRTPVEQLQEPDGLAAVLRVLGAIESGVYL